MISRVEAAERHIFQAGFKLSLTQSTFSTKFELEEGVNEIIRSTISIVRKVKQMDNNELFLMKLRCELNLLVKIIHLRWAVAKH